MEDNKTNPSTNLVVTTNNTTTVKEKSDQTILAEMQQDFNDGLVQSAMESPMIAPHMEKLRMVVKPALMMAAQKLGNDEIRYMLWRDPETQSLIIETVKMSNVQLSYTEDPTAADLFVVPENPDNVDELIEELFKKLISNVKMY